MYVRVSIEHIGKTTMALSSEFLFSHLGQLCTIT